jgi:ribose 1,5-bisphosphokinase
MPRAAKHGRFIAIVGSSGVGKDSLIDGLCAAEPSFVRCRRVITRHPSSVGEDFEAISEPDFIVRADRGEFLLWWCAHGLMYAIPHEITGTLESGRDVLVNLSRTKLDEAANKISGLIVLQVTASPDILADRLAARGRESAEGVQSRLSRPAPKIPAGLSMISVVNDGPLSDTITQALDALSMQTV